MTKKILVLCAIILTLGACVKTPDPLEYKSVKWLDQGWSEAEREWFHHASQGTATVPMPYEYFVELMQPINLKDLYKGDINKKFSDPDYLKYFGFIPSEGPSVSNPDNLPIGLVKTADIPSAAGGTFNGIGFTCAACHTGQMTYKETNIRIDGGPAITNLDLFGEALGIAFFESTKAVPTRYARYKKAVVKRLKISYPSKSENVLKAEFDATAKGIKHILEAQVKLGLMMKSKTVAAGFTRLDALHGIRNRVFGSFNSKNIAPSNAPVSYPYLWSTSWFNWVQYDASIMQPMIRNAGEAMGVGAWVQMREGPDQFDSSVNFENLYRMETMLGGQESPLQNPVGFKGLTAPKWPTDIFGTTDAQLAAKGAVLYNQLCVECHRPPVSDPAFWSDNYWKQIKGEGEKYYQVKIKSIGAIGTDPAQSKVLAAKNVNLQGLGPKMNGGVCGVVDGKWTTVQVKDTTSQYFGYSLGLIVQRVLEQYYKKNNIDLATQEKMNGGRPNCIEAPGGYKARPLNGVWATAPFLHNSSVPNLYEMLSPVSERSGTIYLGYQGFDPKKVGFISTRDDGLPHTTGLTKVVVAKKDKAVEGNWNSGHEFSDAPGSGVIGPSLTEDQRWQLVEYLKTL
ncbi:MAG: di-heme-cytochrome C peroxidase [Sneathiella sp.]